MKLFFRHSGKGHPLIILHGLLGSSDNWYSLAKVFSEHYSVYTVDQRNHGQSPHSDEFNYHLLTEDLEGFIREQAISKPYIIGHSMGGKTAMNFAVKYPHLPGKLVVVDIVPKKYPVHHDHILEGLHAIDLATLTNRAQADQLLSRHVPEPAVRQFLLKNLSRQADGTFEWKVNIHALDDHMEELGDGMIYPGRYEGPALFVKGARSNYHAPGDEERIREIFPSARFVTLNTGHWVQAEDPQGFAKVVREFLESN
jgi:esterase